MFYKVDLSEHTALQLNNYFSELKTYILTNTKRNMKTLPTAEELRKGVTDFSFFAFELLEKVESNKSYLKFAAVNIQIALELFLKYYYVKLGKVDLIQKKKGGVLQNDFVEFSKILNNFYSSRHWSFGEKKELILLLEARNSIVHRSQNQNWDEELAKNVVRTLFFIHATAWSSLNETILFNNHNPHKISKNRIWRRGAEGFAEKISSLHECKIITCFACQAKSAVYGNFMALEVYHTKDDLICLNCLISIDTTEEARVIECFECYNKTYIIDAYNETEGQLHVGKCSECGLNEMVRRCLSCDKYYHPDASIEVFVYGKYFCSSTCEEHHNESHV